jgi:hypothetical protein
VRGRRASDLNPPSPRWPRPFPASLSVSKRRTGGLAWGSSRSCSRSRCWPARFLAPRPSRSRTVSGGHQGTSTSASHRGLARPFLVRNNAAGCPSRTQPAVFPKGKRGHCREKKRGQTREYIAQPAGATWSVYRANSRKTHAAGCITTTQPAALHAGYIVGIVGKTTRPAASPRDTVGPPFFPQDAWTGMILA